MSVFNGQIADAAAWNNGFISRIVDSDTLGKVDLVNTDVVNSGSSIFNIQRELNKLNAFLGSVSNTLPGTLPTWTYNDVGASTDDVKLRADLLTQKFNDTAGHSHDGSPGGGAPVVAADLADFNQYFAVTQTDILTPGAGLDDDVTSIFTGLTPGGGPSSLGVPTTAPYNLVELRTEPAGDKIEEPGGKKVYGRVTESAGTWTLTYYYRDTLGVETAYSLPSQDIRLFWKQVFDADTRPTFDDGFIDSFDSTADIVDATATVPGRVSTVAQAFGGEKTFNDGAVFEKAISTQKTDVASGTIPALTSTYSFVKLTGVSATTLQGIVAPLTAKRILVYNNSTLDLTVKHQDVAASANDRIITADSGDLVIGTKESVEFIYDLSQNRWLVASTPGGGGGVGFQETPTGTVNGINDTFGPLTFLPSSDESVIVYVDGIAQEFTTAWTISGSTITFQPGYVPLTGQSVYAFYLTEGSPAVPVMSGTYRAEYRTLTSGEASAKQLTLAFTPATPAYVSLDVIGGGPQFFGDDFTVSGATLDWNGLGLDGVLVTGDKLRIIYVE